MADTVKTIPGIARSAGRQYAAVPGQTDTYVEIVSTLIGSEITTPLGKVRREDPEKIPIASVLASILGGAGSVIPGLLGAYPLGFVGLPYSGSLTLIDAIGILISGSPAPGISIDPATSVASGFATAAGNFSLTMTPIGSSGSGPATVKEMVIVPITADRTDVTVDAVGNTAATNLFALAGRINAAIAALTEARA